MGRNQDVVFVCPESMPPVYLNLVSVCTAQYAESGLIFIMRFAEIRTVLVLMLHFAGSNPDGILSLSTEDHFASCGSSVRSQKWISYSFPHGSNIR